MNCNIINELNNKLKYNYVEDKIDSNQDAITEAIEAFNNYTKRAIQNSLTYKLSIILKHNIKYIDNLLDKNFSIYKTTKEYINNISELTSVQQFIHWFNNDKFYFKDIQHKFLTIYQNAIEERNKIDDTYVANLDKKLKKHFTEEEIKKLNKLYGTNGIFILTRDDTYNRIITGEKVEDLLKEIKLNKQELEYAYNIYYLSQNKPLTKSIVASPYFLNYSTDKINDIYKYAVLLSLKDNENLINKLKTYTDIHDELLIASQSMETIYKEMLKDTKDPNYMTYSLHIDIYNKNYEKRIITLEDINNNKFLERNGWKILREPTKDNLGIVYREIQQSYVEGVGTTLNYNLNELIVPKELVKKYKDNYILTSLDKKNNTYLLPLTQKEKEILGLVENPAHTLYRSISKYKFIKDTQIIRNALLDKTLTYKLDINNKESIDTLINLINKKEHPFYIKLPDNVIYQSLPKEIKDKYEQVISISSISGLKDKVTLVRKDITPWLQGYSKISFNSSPLINKMLDTLQKFVIMGKIHYVVANPTKLLMDGISNISLLMSKGVSPIYITKQLPKANKEIAELHKLKSELVYAKYLDILDPSQNRTKKVENKIKNHPLNFIYYNGMVTSLSTDIFMKSFDTVSGLQQDIDSVVKKIITKVDKEDYNTLGKIIKWYMNIGSKAGLTVDALLYKLSSIGNKGILKESLKEIADNMKETREQQDVIRYVSNFINAPASNITKFGSIIMQYEDLIARIIYYRYLKQNSKLSEPEIIQEVMDTFIDYRINMPKELQFLSDTFIIPFPYYLLKVQKVILNLIKHRPATTSPILIYDLLNPYSQTNNLSIIGSNIIEKIEKGQIEGNPIDIISIFQ